MEQRCKYELLQQQKICGGGNGMVLLQQQMKIYYDLELQNDMLQWLKLHRSGSYAQYIAAKFPENVQLDDAGVVTWMDDRIIHPEWSGTFEELDPSMALYDIGEAPPMTPEDALAFKQRRDGAEAVPAASGR
jgi:hypothetical protein